MWINFVKSLINFPFFDRNSCWNLINFGPLLSIWGPYSTIWIYRLGPDIFTFTVLIFKIATFARISEYDRISLKYQCAFRNTNSRDFRHNSRIKIGKWTTHRKQSQKWNFQNDSKCSSKFDWFQPILTIIATLVANNWKVHINESKQYRHSWRDCLQNWLKIKQKW